MFIHDALCEVIQSGDTEIKASRLKSTLESMAETLPGQTITGFQEQFQVSPLTISTWYKSFALTVGDKCLYITTFIVNMYH